MPNDTILVLAAIVLAFVAFAAALAWADFRAGGTWNDQRPAK